MATKRYVFYVDSEDSKSILTPWMRAQTHVQVLSKLPDVPQWLQTIPKPVLVDVLKTEAVWGTEIAVLMESRKPPSKFAPVEELE